MGFQKGFATRAQLKRHNTTYHTEIDDKRSLADEMRALKKKRLAEDKPWGKSLEATSDVSC